MLISDLGNQDTEKVLRMALLHDLQESIVGDLTKDSLEYSNKKRLEEEAVREILKPLPNTIRDCYINIWREYCEGNTPEARVVKYADKLDMLAQAEEYQRQGYNVEDFWKEKYEFQGKSKKIYQTLRALFLQHRNSTR
jgi:putative hydrolase of HD superfamily